ncbi:MAG: transcription-repair coupling factor [Myxococcota bacterium]
MDQAKEQTGGRLARIAEALERGERPVEIVGALGGFAGFVLAALRQAHPRTLIVVTPDEARAEQIRLGLDFFEPPRSVLEPVPAFGALDHTPFSGMSPSRLLVMERVTTLFRLVHGLDVAAVVVPAKALVDRVVPRRALADQAERIEVDDELDREALLSFLVETGYHDVPAVEDPGTFAVRGGIVDVFSPMYTYPVRLELWGDVVDTMRFFDPTTQRTHSDVQSITLGPVRDIHFDEASIRRSRASILALADDLHVPTSRARALIEDVQSGILGVGMEDLLPAFHERLDTLFDVAPDDALWLVDEPDRCREAIEQRWEDVSTRSERVREARGELAFAADSLYLPAEETLAALEERTAGRLVPFAMVDEPARVSLRFDVADNADVRKDIEDATRQGDEHVLAPLTSRVAGWRRDGRVVVVCAHTEGGAERVRGLLGHYGTKVERHEGDFHLGLLEDLRADPSDVHLFVGDPGQGFRSPELGLVLVDESEVLGRKVRRRRHRHAQVAPEAALASWRDLEEGDYVVHLLHGIGRYLGLTKTAVGGYEVDFLVIEYARQHKLFVPVDKLHLVSKHTPGSSSHGDGAPKLDKLGGTGWVRRKKRVKKAVRDIADKLLKLYAEREMRPGHAFTPPGEYFARFEAAFPWEETPDQVRAIEEILEDMEKPRPMDRLLCGDVGFGKTEVALRGAFLAVLDGKQVALLVPTVVLAEQHKMTIERRLEGFPVVVESLTRTKSAKEAKAVKERLARGEIDILIGTHRILSKDVEWRRLGMVILDEEQRFGVAQKERLKRVQPNVDILTLTATPIPRTLHMSMTGMRDISLIQTPPMDRLAIHTLVAQPTEQVITEAIRTELKRGGQVFFLHNRVEDIERRAELVQRLVPEARVAVGHGQMDKGELERTMLRFMRGEANVLVCTTIIESGLDIPNANTILINRADRFGLAQLYQLRGRVGRSSVRAYCYLLIPAPKSLTGDAARRIATIQRFTELGSGFSIASHDLDIRGAGDILGADQAGQIESVGYDAYMKMLEEAIEELRAEEEDREPVERIDPDLKIAVEARIPERWLPDTTLRLRFYKRLAGAESVDELFETYREAVDRYGKPPEPVTNLVDLMAIKLEAAQLGIASVGYNRSSMSFGLTDRGPLTGEAIARLLQSRAFRATPDMQLTRPVEPDEWQRGLHALRDQIRELHELAQEAA